MRQSPSAVASIHHVFTTYSSLKTKGDSETAKRNATTRCLRLLALVGMASLLSTHVPSAQSQSASNAPEWAWMGGNNTVPAGKGQPGVYGTQFQFAPSNVPGGRNWGALSWTDQSGRLWLFGGLGYDASGTAGYLGDMWVFDPSQGTDGEWAWMGGSSTLSTNSVGYTGQPAVYGTEYQFAPSNVPGGRNFAINWTDASGRFWLLGGEGGFDGAGNVGYFSDLWVFDPSQGTYGEWAWMGGSNTAPAVQFACDQPANYGTEYQFADSNYPGHREASATWTDQSGRLWLLGGAGCEFAGSPSETVNDLWVFDPSQGAHGEWAWMGGVNAGYANGTYGTEYQFADSNVPGARANASGWTDTSGRLWLFGGYGYDSAGNPNQLNDLWVFDPSQGVHGEWAWMGGSKTALAIGAYGTEYQFADSNVPGARYEAMDWIDKNGKLWLFGGLGNDSLTNFAYLNDLWVFDPSLGAHGEWAWMGGSNRFSTGFGSSGVYGTEYQFTTSSMPGGRNTGATWVDPGGKLWLFGGEGYDSQANIGLLNDLWELQVPSVLLSPTMTWSTPAPIMYGTALTSAQLNATANVPGTFTYNPAAGTTLAAGIQQLTVMFTPTDSANYSTANAAVQLTVNKATPVITWPTPAAITYGTALSAAQLDATANVPGTFLYSPASGSVLTAGTLTLHVTFTPTDSTDYTTATSSVLLTVTKATPAITWPTPASIASGTPLSSTQLNATANVPGTFAYSPAAGTILPVGSNTLNVTFTPTDSANYTTAGSSVPLVVNAPSFTLAASPNALAVQQGGKASTAIAIASSGGFTGSVTLSASGLPKGVTAAFSKNPTNTGSTITFTATNGATLGTSVVTITGKSGTLNQITLVTLTVAHK